MGKMSELESQRLCFRKLTPEDVTETYVGWLNDPEINRYLEIRFVEHTLESCRSFVEHTNMDPGSHLFGIMDKISRSHIGNIKLGFINKRHQRGELSFFIGAKSFQGRGLATEAVREITKWGFLRLGLRKIEAGCYDVNLPSLRCLLKSGYFIEGYSRDSFELEDRRIGCFRLGALPERFLSRAD